MLLKITPSYKKNEASTRHQRFSPYKLLYFREQSLSFSLIEVSSASISRWHFARLYPTSLSRIVSLHHSDGPPSYARRLITTVKCLSWNVEKQYKTKYKERYRFRSARLLLHSFQCSLFHIGFHVLEAMPCYEGEVLTSHDCQLAEDPFLRCSMDSLRECFMGL